MTTHHKTSKGTCLHIRVLFVVSLVFFPLFYLHRESPRFFIWDFVEVLLSAEREEGLHVVLFEESNRNTTRHNFYWNNNLGNKRVVGATRCFSSFTDDVVGQKKGFFVIFYTRSKRDIACSNRDLHFSCAPCSYYKWWSRCCSPVSYSPQ